MYMSAHVHYFIHFLQKPNLIGEYSVHKLRHRPIRLTSSNTADHTSFEALSSYPPTVSPAPHSGVGDSDSDTPGGSPQRAPPNQKQKKWQTTNQTEDLSSSDNKSTVKRPHELELVRNTDSEPLSDDSGPPPSSKKSVAINTSQNEHFSHRLLPVQSPEFDNVINQVCTVHHSLRVAVVVCLISRLFGSPKEKFNKLNHSLIV